MKSLKDLRDVQITVTWHAGTFYAAIEVLEAAGVAFDEIKRSTTRCPRQPSTFAPQVAEIWDTFSSSVFAMAVPRAEPVVKYPRQEFDFSKVGPCRLICKVFFG